MGDAGGVFSEFMLPYLDCRPPHRSELFPVKPVPFQVPLELSTPEFSVCFWERVGMDGAPVPETSMDEDGKPLLVVDEIGAPWKVRKRSLLAKVFG